jgi:hypothetical protein
MKPAVLLVIAALTSGCVEATDPPNTAAAQLHDDDLNILGVALDAALITEYGRTDGAAKAQLVTPDRTIRACDSPQPQPFTYECMALDDLEMVSGYVRELFGGNGPAVFRERNRVAHTIRGDVDGLQVVPGEALLKLLQQPRWESELRSLFPGKQGVVIFSSPAYPAQGQSIVYVLHAVTRRP